MRIIMQEKYAKTLYKDYKVFYNVEDFIKFFNNRIVAAEYYADDITIYRPDCFLETSYFDYPRYKFVITNDVDNEQLIRNIIVCKIPVTDKPKNCVNFNDIHDLQNAYGCSLDNFNPEIFSIKNIIDMLNGDRKDSLNNTIDVLHTLNFY